jgi:hypothetical protein
MICRWRALAARASSLLLLVATACGEQQQLGDPDSGDAQQTGDSAMRQPGDAEAGAGPCAMECETNAKTCGEPASEIPVGCAAFCAHYPLSQLACFQSTPLSCNTIASAFDALDSGFSGTCLTNAGIAPLVNDVEASGPLPSGTGGSIADGTYFLTTRTIYAPASYDPILREAMRVSGHELVFVVEEEGGPDEGRPGWATYQTEATPETPGPILSWAPSWGCPPVPPNPCATSNSVSPEQAEYTATPSALTLIYGDEETTGDVNVVLTFERQGD